MNQWQLDAYNKTRLEQEIELMKHSIDSYSRNSHYGQEDQTYECESRIFNAAVNLGEFDLAYKYAKTTDQKKLIQRLIMAFLREENEACKCHPDVMPGNIELPLFFNWRRIYNKRVGIWVDVYKCSKCNFATINSNAVCTQSARNLERVKAKPENNNPKNKIKDHEALRQ